MATLLAPLTGWSTSLAFAAGSHNLFTATPGAASSLRLQWSPDGTTWTDFPTSYLAAASGYLPPSAAFLRGFSQGPVAGTFAQALDATQADPAAPLSPTTTLLSALQTAQQSVAASYAGLSYGDSRCRILSAGTTIGNTGTGTALANNRIFPWICFYLGDADPVSDYGISGDTLISSSSSTGWNGIARANSKTFANAAQSRPDFVYIQYGINDLPTASSANLIIAAKALVSAWIAAGARVCISNIMTFDPYSSGANITPANGPATLVKIAAFGAAMQAFVANLGGRAVYVDPNSLITNPLTGYADQQYIASADGLGVHPNKLGAQLMGFQAATAIRTILPLRNAKTYTAGPLENVNFINWGEAAANNLFVSNSVTGTTSANTPTWNIGAVTGMPYAEVTITVTALTSGTAQALFQVAATDVAGATPKWLISIGDLLQGSARVTVDDGNGNAVALQSTTLRQRLFNTVPTSQFFADWGGVASSTDLTTLPGPIDGRLVTPACVTPIANATISTPAAGQGYYLGFFLEVPALGTYRVRIHAPALRMVSRRQYAAVTAGASPYVFQNNPQPFVLNDFVNATGRRMQVTVAPGAGGTISDIGLFRAPTTAGSPTTIVSTTLTSGVFVLEPGDGLVVTWATTAAELRYSYLTTP